MEPASDTVRGARVACFWTVVPGRMIALAPMVPCKTGGQSASRTRCRVNTLNDLLFASQTNIQWLQQCNQFRLSLARDEQLKPALPASLVLAVDLFRTDGAFAGMMMMMIFEDENKAPDPRRRLALREWFLGLVASMWQSCRCRLQQPCTHSL